jgi:hypothetical protein
MRFIVIQNSFIRLWKNLANLVGIFYGMIWESYRNIRDFIVNHFSQIEIWYMIRADSEGVGVEEISKQ